MATHRSFLNFGAKGSEEQTSNNDAETEQSPLFSVVSGQPTEEELAALTAVLLSLQAPASKQDNSAMVAWQRRLYRGHRLGERLRPGPGSWRRARPM